MTVKKNKTKERKLLLVLLDSVTSLGSIVSYLFVTTLKTTKKMSNLLTHLVKELIATFVKQLTRLSYVFIPLALGAFTAFLAYIFLTYALNLPKTSEANTKKHILIFDRNNNFLYKAYTQDLLKPPANMALTYKRAPYAVDYVLSKLMDSYEHEVRSGKSLRVKTTIDLGVQNVTQQKLLEHTNDSNTKKLSLSLINPLKGEILAMVNSTNYYDKPNSLLDLKHFQQFELQVQLSTMSVNKGKYVDVVPFIEIMNEQGKVLFSQKNRSINQILRSFIKRSAFLVQSSTITNVLTYELSPSVIFSVLEVEPIPQALLESISKELVAKWNDKKLSKEFK